MSVDDYLALLRETRRIPVTRAWEQASVLWRFVQQAVASRDGSKLAELRSAIAAQPLLRGKNGEPEPQVNRAVALLTCGMLACLDRGVRARRCALRRRARRLAWPSPVNAAWALDVLGLLWNEPRVIERECAVAVAGFWKRDPTAAPEGILATLRLQLVSDGHGEVYHDPGDVFTTKTDRDFDESMTLAWMSARHSASQEHKVDGRWRIEGPWRSFTCGWWRPESKWPPLAEATQQSASAAAFRGWWHVLEGLQPHNELIVIAAVDSADGHVTSVDREGLSQKMQAIVNCKLFDTVLVCRNNLADVQGHAGIGVVVID
jgi:hypothetical protein